MRILITGGAGFIGRNLAKRLIKENHQVTIIDNYFRSNRKAIQSIIGQIKFIEGNICDEKLMKNLVEANDLVFHLASISQVMTSIKNPKLCYKYNVTGTEIVAKLCAKNDKKLIFSSSREVYGNAKYMPVDLKHPLHAENPYSESKIKGENIIMRYAGTHNLKYVIFRISNVIGADDKDRVIPIFLEKAMKAEDIILFGKEKIIDFIYIDDVIDAFIKSINLNENVILNLGSGKKTKLHEAAKIVVKLLDSKSKIIIAPERKGEVDRFCADISLTRKTLNWKPKYNFESSITKICEDK